MSDDPVIALLNGINDRLGRLEHGQTGLQQGQAALQQGQTALQQGLATLQRDQAALQQNQTVLRVDLMARMDRLGDQITSIREDITVNMGAVDSVRTANEGTKAELRALGEMVFTMHRQVRRLQTQVEELSGKPPAA